MLRNQEGLNDMSYFLSERERSELKEKIKRILKI